MLNKFRSLFTPPIFAEDEVKTRTASVLNALLLSLFFGLVLIGIVVKFERPYIFIVILILTTGVRLIMHRGYVHLASVFIVVGLSILFAFIVPITGGVRAVTYGGFLVVVLLAGLLLGRWAAITLALFASLLGITLLGIEALGLWKTPASTASDLTVWIAYTVYFLVTAAVLTLALQLIDEGFRKAQIELTERIHAEEREINRRTMMERVIRIGKSVTEQTSDLHAALIKIWEGVRNGLNLDRAAIFLYNSNDNMMHGSYGTNRSGDMSEESELKFGLNENAFFQSVLSQPDGFYFTQDYAGERNLELRPGHPMEKVKYYAAVSVWAGGKPAALICVDQLLSGRIIADEQLEALRLFAGYAGLAIENTRLNAELKEHAQERENFIQELGKRNAELERFTYTVSHDLRSPLVTIRGFLGMLEKDMRAQEVEKATHDMSRIANATNKMDALLTDLLELSRIGRIVNPSEEVDLFKLAQETMETIDGRLRAKNITVHISPDLPTLSGDRIRLREVLENLIDNAAKYMGDQPNPSIEVGAREQTDGHVIYVKDNGLGIESQYLTRVFGLFEKLNPASEGTGIGLALIKRIIEVHGGDLWAESEGLGKGSTFCFTIPDNKNESKHSGI